jgi:hypothetical protein
MLGSSLLPVVCGRAHVLFTLFVLACVLCCVFLRVVYPVLPDSLDCPFLMAYSSTTQIKLEVKLWNIPHMNYNSKYQPNTNQNHKTPNHDLSKLLCDD